MSQTKPSHFSSSFKASFWSRFRVMLAVVGLLAAMVMPSHVSAEKDSQGKEFWVAFPGNTSIGASQLFIYLVSTGPAEIDVDFAPAALPTPFHQHVSIAGANQVVKVDLPVAPAVTAAQSADIQANDVVEQKAVHITSTADSAEFAVYGFSNGNQTADAFLGFPVDVLGKEYFVVSYGANSTLTAPTNVLNVESGSQFVVVGTAAGTTVTITPTAAIAAHVAGLPYTVTLNAGDTYLGRAAAGTADLTGTLITSDQPVTVMAGNRCGNVPAGTNACDTLLEQLPPSQAWGEKFLTVPYAGRTNGDRYRVVAAENGTQVTINNAAPINLNRGQWHEFILTTTAHIVSNSAHPVQLMQYEHSRRFDTPVQLNDPSMMVVYPYEQYLLDYTVSTPTQTGFDPAIFAAATNYLNLTAPNGAVGNVTVDGVAIPAGAWAPIGTSGYQSTTYQLATVGTHRVTGPRPIGVSVYGGGSVTTYAYPGGMSLSPIALVKYIGLTINGGVKYVGEQICVDAQAQDFANVGVEGVRLDIDTSVTGAVSSTTTNAAGMVTFCYTGTTVGTETVTGTVGSVTATGNVTWLPRPVAPVVTADDKVYDGNVTATISSCFLVETLPSFAGTPTGVSCSASAGTFDGVDVANGRTVTATGITLSGPLVGDFVLTTDTATTTANITPAPLTITASSAAVTYGDPVPVITPSYSAFVNSETPAVLSALPNCTTSYTPASPVGSVPSTSCAGAAALNYFIAYQPGTITIAPKAATVTAGSGTKTYGAADPALSTTQSGFVAGDVAGITLSTTRSSGEDVGGYPTTATAAGGNVGNYDVTYAPGAFTITKATVTVTANPKTITYGDPDPAFDFTYGPFPGPDGAGDVDTTPTCSVASHSGTGSFAITCSGGADNNYDFVYVPGTLTVNPLAATITAGGGTKVFGTADPALSATTSTGFLAGDIAGISLNSARAAGENVGSYPTTPTATGGNSGNYAITPINGTFTITKATVTVTANPKTITYGDPDPAFDFTYGPFPGPDGAGDVDTTPTCTVASHSGIGSFAITCSGGVDNNYDFVYTPGTLTVLPKAATITAGGGTKVFGTADPALSATTSTGITAGDLAGITLNSTRVAGENVGSYVTTATATGGNIGNYTVTYNTGTFTITAKPATVTAGGGTKVYGSADPALSATTSTGITAGDLAGITLASTRAAGENVGSYVTTATATGGNIGNYTVTYNTGTFTITKKAASVVANNKTKTQGAVNPALDGTLTGVVAGDNITATYSTTAVTASPVGSYPITPALVDPNGKLGNYTVTITNGTLTVTGTGPVCVVVAVADAYEANKNQTLNIVAKGILRNDVDPYGRGLVVGAVNGAAAKVGVAVATAHGTVTVNANGGFTYKPATNYVGTDTFTYAAKSVYDNQVSAPATVTITIKAHYDNDGCDHDRSRNRHRDGDGCDHDRSNPSHYSGDGDDHDRGRNGHRSGDGCGHDRDTRRSRSSHYAGDGDDHDRGRNGHRSGDGCSHEQATSHHNDGDNCDHDRGVNGHRDGDDCDHDREDSEHRDGDDCDHDRNRNGHYDGDRCEHDSHHGDDDNDEGTSGCLIQGAGQGRMTGGGTIGTSNARHGFQLSCRTSDESNNLEVNWGNGNKFHLERLTSANCTKDPSINAEQPSSSFNTYLGTGNGRYNGVSGATATWTFTDGGEPGRRDRATIVIKNAAGQVVLSVSGTISNGNQQAHNDRD